jgi:hypothetical protein
MKHVKTTDDGELGQREPYKCIISRNNCNNINPLILKFLVLLNKRRQMLNLTSRRKSPRNSKQNYLLPFEFLKSAESTDTHRQSAPIVGYSCTENTDWRDYLMSIVIFGSPASDDVGCFGCVRDIFEGNRGKRIADFQSHFQSCLLFGKDGLCFL